MSNQKKITVMVVDDHPIFREGLVTVIQKSDEIDVVATAENGRSAIDYAQQVRPDIAILDVAMPGIDGIETAKQMKHLLPSLEIIFLTMHKNRSILRSMRTLGVKGYVLKDAGMNEIVQCVKTVFAGQPYISPKLADLVISVASALPALPAATVMDGLTESEKRVFFQIAESKTTKQIADDLSVSSRTVETHRHNICLKLGLTGPHALFKFAVANLSEINSAQRSK